MGISVELGTMWVNYKARTDDLAKGMSTSKVAMSDADKTAQSSGKNISSAFSQAGSSVLEFGSKTVTGIDTAKARIVLIESKVREARDEIKRLEGAADAGKSVTGLEEARAKLTLLEGEAQKARSGLQKLEQGANEASGSLKDKLSSAAHSAGSSLLDMGSKLSMVGMGIKGLIDTAINAGQSLLAPVFSAEQLGISFTTLMGSADGAAKEIAKLNKFADITPFEPGPVQQYDAQLIGLGIDAKDTVPIMTSLGDALFGIGHGTEAEMGSVVDQIGKIRVAGVMTWGDISQLQTHGINVLNAMSRATGKSEEELRAMSTSGIDAGYAIDALTRGIEMNPLYQGGMAKQSNSAAGIMSTLSGYTKTALNSFLGLKDGMIVTGGIFDKFKTVLGSVSSAMQSPAFQEFASTMGEKVGVALQTVGVFISTNVSPAIAGFMGYLKSPDFAAFTGNMQYLGTEVSSVVVPAFNDLKPAASTVFDSVGPTLKTVTTDVGLFARGIGGVIQFFKDGSPPAQILGAALLGIGVAFAAIQIGAFLATVPALIAGFIGWAATAGAAAIATIAATWPLLAIGAVIALVVAGIILAVTHWGDITTWFSGLWTTVWGAVSGFFSNIIKFIMDNAVNFGIGLFLVITGPIGLLALFIISHWTQIWSFLVGIWGNIQAAFGTVNSFFAGIGMGMWNGIKGGINLIISGVNMFIRWLNGVQIIIPGVHVGPVQYDGLSIGLPKIPMIPRLAMGGVVLPGQFAVTGEAGQELVYGGTSGASVYSHSQSSNLIMAAVLAALAQQQQAPAGGVIEIHQHIHLDEREIGESIERYQLATLRSQGGVRR